MINLDLALSYEEYMDKLTEDHKAVYEKTFIAEDTKDTLKGLDRKINAIVFSEGFCPDCTVSLPILKRFQEINSNIKINMLPREGNESFLEENLGEARIPTFMFFDENMNPLGVFVEFPESLKEKIALAKMDEKQQFVREYREGKYNNLIEKDFLNIIFS